MERSGIPLSDSVGVNCKKEATTNVKAHMRLVYGVRGVCWTIMHALSNFHDYPSLKDGEVVCHMYYRRHK